MSMSMSIWAVLPLMKVQISEGVPYQWAYNICKQKLCLFDTIKC
jgi:hypothetical protein